MGGKEILINLVHLTNTEVIATGLRPQYFGT